MDYCVRMWYLKNKKNKKNKIENRPTDPPDFGAKRTIQPFFVWPYYKMQYFNMQ